MLKSPAEYLAELAFDLPDSSQGPLSPAERVFVDKYLGLDERENTTEQLLAPPEPMPLPERRSASPRPELRPRIHVPPIEIALPPPPTPVIEIASPKIAVQEQAPAVTSETTVVEETAIPEIASVTVEIAPPKPAAVVEAVKEDAIAPVETPVRVAEQVAKVVETVAPAEVLKETTDQIITVVEKPATARVETITPETAAAKEVEKAPASVEIPLREKLRASSEIQMVSFFISGQLFLLPVAAIQEVIRQMEIIKVPQAPEFVAGAINLRGAVIPVVKLSALLTNGDAQPPNPRDFIIICGTEELKLGLIIDRINSMHLLPQKKIIWNMESRLGGDASEFLYAIADLDDKVCGIVAPEIIAQHIMTP